MTGWGHDGASGLDYWVVRNSWGSYWGSQGWFKLAKGINNLGIETDCAWATPANDGKPTQYTIPSTDGGGEEEEVVEKEEEGEQEEPLLPPPPPPHVAASRSLRAIEGVDASTFTPGTYRSVTCLSRPPPHLHLPEPATSITSTG